MTRWRTKQHEVPPKAAQSADVENRNSAVVGPVLLEMEWSQGSLMRDNVAPPYADADDTLGVYTDNSFRYMRSTANGSASHGVNMLLVCRLDPVALLPRMLIQHRYSNDAMG